MSGLQELNTTNAFYYLAKANASQDSLFDKEQKVSKEDAIKQAILQQVGNINDLFSKLALLTFLKKAYANASDADLTSFINSLYNQSKNVENQIWQIFYGHFKDSKSAVTDGGKDDYGNFLTVLDKLDKQERRSRWNGYSYFPGDYIPNAEKKDQAQIDSATKTIESLLKSKNPDNLQALEGAVNQLGDGLQKEQSWVNKNDPVSKASNWLYKKINNAGAKNIDSIQKLNEHYVLNYIAKAVSGSIGLFSEEFAQRNMWKAIAGVITPLQGALTSEKAAVEILSVSCSEDSNTISIRMQEYKKTDTDYTNFLKDDLKTATTLISDAVIYNN